MKRVALLWLMVAGCGESTRVVITIDNGGLSVPTDVDAVLVRVGNRATPGVWWKDGPVAPLCPASGNCKNFPLTLGVFPANFRGTVLVQVDALRGTEVVSSDAATFTFVDGRREVVEFVLRPLCRGSRCSATEMACNPSGQCQPLGIEGFGMGGSDGGGGGGDLAMTPVADLATSRDLAGPSWIAVTPLPGTTGIVVKLAAPASPRGLLYAGTSLGLFSSSDGGNAWGMTNLLPSGADSKTLAVDPTNSMNLYLGGGNTVQQSMNGGMSFGVVLNQGSRAVAIDGANGWVYSISNSNGGVQYNPGSGWAALNTGLTSTMLYALALDAGFVYVSSSNVLFQLARNSSGAWTPVTGAPQSISAFVVAADGTIYVGGAFSGLRKSSDKSTWTMVNAPPGTVFELLPHPTNARVMYAAATMGVYKMIDGASWFPKNEGLADTEVRSIAMDPGDPEVLWAGTRSGVIYKTLTGGE